MRHKVVGTQQHCLLFFFSPCEKMQEQSSAYECIKANGDVAAMPVLMSLPVT